MTVGRLPVRKRFSLVAILLLTAVSAEVLLRLAHRVVYGIPVTTFLPVYRDTRFQESPFLVFGPRIGWQIPGKPHPELATFDQNGFRTIEPLEPRMDGEIRIVAMGGSTTEDVWNEAGIHWPLVAQCILRREGYPVRILNGAMSAYSTAHSLVRLQFSVLDRARPDIVLVMHLVNDLTVTYEAAAQGKEVDPAYLVKFGQKWYTGEVGPSDVVVSRLFRAVSSRIGAQEIEFVSPSEWVYDLSIGEHYFRRNLRLLAYAIRDSGAEPIFLTMPRSSDPEYHRISAEEVRLGMPGLGLFPEVDRFLRDFEVFNSAIRDKASRMGIHVVDLAQSVPDRRELFVDPVHFSTEGSLEMGKRVAEGLVARLPSPRLEPVPPGPECELIEGLINPAGISSSNEANPFNLPARRMAVSVGRRRSPSIFRMDRRPPDMVIHAA